MDRNRKQDVDRPNKASSMEPAEGSRETVTDSESAKDLGTSGDRAMSDAGSSDDVERDRMSQERSAERGKASSGRHKAGGITNRDLDRERSEQQQLPDRGRSQQEQEPVMPDDRSTLRTKI